jgi:uncharacterized protein (TIGR02246 family)
MTADEQVIGGILQQLETAWNRYDSVAFAASFAEDANFIHIFGGQLDGRTAIAAAQPALQLSGETGTALNRMTRQWIRANIAIRRGFTPTTAGR